MAVFHNIINVDNGSKKIPLLYKTFYRGNWDSVVILGSSNSPDVRGLVEIASMEKLPVILVDMYQKELDAHQYGLKLQLDMSKMVNLYNIINIIKALNSKNPLFYDNLCGGPTRIPFLKLILNEFGSVLSFVSSRHGNLATLNTLGTVVHSWYGKCNNIAFITANKPHVIKKRELRRFPPAYHIKRQKCPKCNATSNWCSIRKNEEKKHHCCKCKHEW